MRDVLVEELELSVRGSEWIEGLGVSTVGQLLDLPRLAFPDDWPPAIARMVAAELTEVFQELNVEYTGELVVPPPATAALQATGSVAERWATIRAWLQTHHPDALEQFNPAASPDAIAAVERARGITLPDDYKTFLAIHDGQDEFAPFVGLGALLPIAEVADTELFGEEMEVPADCVGEGVRAVDWSPGWIPISRSARGRDFLCIDLDPGPGGVRGQIIEYVVDDDGRPLVAKSFADLLSVYFEQAQTGEIDFDV